jgi:hypothetical protein
MPRIAGAVLFEPVPHVDERGLFCRTFDTDVMRAAGIDPAAFAQDSIRRTCPIALTARTTLPKTYRLPSMTPNWPSRGRFPSPPCRGGTG